MTTYYPLAQAQASAASLIVPTVMALGARGERA